MGPLDPLLGLALATVPIIQSKWAEKGSDLRLRLDLLACVTPRAHTRHEAASSAIVHIVFNFMSGEDSDVGLLFCGMYMTQMIAAMDML